MTVRTRLSRLLLAAARRLDPAAGEHAPAEGDYQARVNASIVPAGWRDAARDAHGVEIEVGDRVRWVGRPDGGPQSGAAGYAKATYNPSHVWFWLDEPTGEGPCGQYWDCNPWNLERID